MLANGRVYRRQVAIMLLHSCLFFKFIYLFILAVLVFVAVWAFSSCSKQGLLFITMCSLLIEVASFVVEHRLQSLWLSYSEVCGIYLDQGFNPCPLHWQANS